MAFGVWPHWLSVPVPTEVPLKQDPAPEQVDVRGPVWTVWTAFAIVTLTATGPDPDLWGHVRFGLDWLASLTLPTTDPYSFTQNRPWINHEWLSEAAMGAAYLLAGTPGLVLLKTGVMGATLGILYSRLRGGTPMVAALVLAAAVVAALPISLTVRPQLWSALALAATAALLDKEGPPTIGRIAGCAFVFMCWANLHGGWITGAAVLSVYSAVRLLQSPGRWLRWLAMIGVPIAATLVNPYGLGLWRFLSSTVRASRPDISEWQPMGMESPLILWVPIAMALVLVAVLSRDARTRPSLAVWAALLLLTAAAIRVHRVAPLMGPASLVLLAPSIVRAWGHRGRVRVPDRRAAAVLWVPAAVALLAVSRPSAAALTCLPVRSDWAPDQAVASSLKGLRGTLVTTFDWGEYAIWHFGPELRVSIDGRRETVYSDEVIQLHRRFERADPVALERMHALAPDYVWLPASRAETKRWLAGNGYRIDIDEADSFVAVRQGLPPVEPSAAARASRCFP